MIKEKPGKMIDCYISFLTVGSICYLLGSTSLTENLNAKYFRFVSSRDKEGWCMVTRSSRLAISIGGHPCVSHQLLPLMSSQIIFIPTPLLFLLLLMKVIWDQKNEEFCHFLLLFSFGDGDYDEIHGLIVSNVWIVLFHYFFLLQSFFNFFFLFG